MGPGAIRVPSLPHDAIERWTGAYFGVTGATTFDGDIGRPGIAAGFYSTANNLVIGIESALLAPGLRNSYAFSQRWDGSLTAIVGYKVGGFLPYFGLGGSVTEAFLDNPFAGDAGWRAGWHLAGGVKLPIAENVFGSVEYRYKDFGVLSSPLGEVRAATSELRLGLMYRLPPGGVRALWR